MPLKEQHSHLEIAFTSIACFQNNGSLDETESGPVSVPVVPR